MDNLGYFYFCNVKVSTETEANPKILTVNTNIDRKIMVRQYNTFSSLCGVCRYYFQVAFRPIQFCQ